MNSYWYKEYKTLTGDWALEVRRGVVPIGNIRKNKSTGRYEFFNKGVTRLWRLSVTASISIRCGKG